MDTKMMSLKGKLRCKGRNGYFTADSIYGIGLPAVDEGPARQCAPFCVIQISSKKPAKSPPLSMEFRDPDDLRAFITMLEKIYEEVVD